MSGVRGFLGRMKDKGWVPLKYLFSSCLAFGIDYALHLALEAALPFSFAMEAGGFAAWLVSSLTNFFVNRHFVFRSAAPLKAALPEYYSLALVVHLIKNYVLLEILVRGMQVPLGLAKPIGEVVLFAGNYLIQKKFIFKKQKKDGGSDA